ncbi:hypothetical protein [Mucilaginibacter ginsenosidivorans]|uniref:Uncharacterized protein n=1 Tax=Mucilaginibacter ginsenosidivorans TaxID=398053 RepID=A0A5B8UUF3_9SPHI|nr:hypothetical protein [Mucilaginibacter ginsenosidivorans]QEC62518.1 hypothetical protein FRZ54_07925 [Mucilaginibacter ginsenosidivorans]
MNPVNSIAQLSGYKIAGSHFRIGSKIHISEFYYAKRFFQNSFFATRMAFILANEIIETTDGATLRRIRGTGLTLVGYGIYSELLLSLVEKFLRTQWQLSYEKLNHSLVLDSEEMELVNQTSFQQNALIIVPIASTFSTSIKIQEKIQKTFKLLKVTPKHYNILYIADGPNKNDLLSKLEREFGWLEKSALKKTVTIQTYGEGNPSKITQKYFLSLESAWQRIESCNHCFPELQNKELLDERPLFETDKTAVTPSLIFDLPKGRHIEKDDNRRPFKLTPDLIVYGHHTRNNSHFLFSVKTEDFLNKNYAAIDSWLDTCRKTMTDEKIISPSDHVMIASNCHYSNAAFINLVNEKLFSSAATIIHYDPANDYIQNFEMVYGREIGRADKIFFVDDSLKSGSSFLKIYEFIEQTMAGSKTGGATKGITAAFFLLNKAQAFTVNSVERKLTQPNGIFAFANLHLYTSLSHDQESPLLIEQRRYRDLTSDSFLDSLKTHFTEQAAKLAIKERDTKSPLKQERHLRMLEATHLIYNYFASNSLSSDDFGDFHAFKEQLYAETNRPVQFAVYDDVASGVGISEDEAAVLKVLTQSPFVQYEPLKKVVFKWILKLLDNYIRALQKKGRTLSYDDFEHFKFLTRRVGLLNSNYLISKKMFSFLRDFFLENVIDQLKIKVQEDLDLAEQKIKDQGDMFKEVNINARDVVKARLTNLKDFIIFYTAQIKELLLQNESRGIKLESLLLQEASKGNAAYRQLIRILTVENGILVKRFYDFIRKQEAWPELYKPRKDAEDEINESTGPIEALLRKQQVFGHYKYQNLVNYSNAEAFPDFKGNLSDPSSSPLLLNYLWLMYFFQFDAYKKEHELAVRTELIIKKLKDFFDDPMGGPSMIGSFLSIKRGADTMLVYNRNHKGREELDDDKWLESNPYLQQFQDGQLDESGTYRKTVIELKKLGVKEQWIDQYDINKACVMPGIQVDFLPTEINSLLLVRLNRADRKGDNRTQGLLGFYFKSPKDTLTSSSLIKYLLLVRPALSLFLESHHENDEYHAWLLSEKTKRLALLSGHGKEMIKSLSLSGPLKSVYSRIALNLEQLQMIILFNSAVRNNTMDQIKERFNQFYHVSGSLAIDQAFLNSLKDMANDIYENFRIENPVDFLPVFSADKNRLPFAFSRNILELICFELFVNAKKNRWHPMPGDDPLLKNKLTVQFKISTEVDKRFLDLYVTSTGPRVLEDHVQKLNDKNNNIKTDDPVSGTSLIKTLVNNYLEGKISFDNKDRPAGESFGEFIVHIRLKEMTGND